MDTSIEYYKVRENIKTKIKQKIKEHIKKYQTENNLINAIGFILLILLLLIAKENGLFDYPTKYIFIRITYGSLAKN